MVFELDQGEINQRGIPQTIDIAVEGLDGGVPAAVHGGAAVKDEGNESRGSRGSLGGFGFFGHEFNGLVCWTQDPKCERLRCSPTYRPISACER